MANKKRKKKQTKILKLKLTRAIMCGNSPLYYKTQKNSFEKIDLAGSTRREGG